MFLNYKIIKNIKPFHILLSRDAGPGKSHLMKTIYMSISKVLIYKDDHQKKPRILLLALTDVAVIHIDGTAIHTALGITVGIKLYSLNDHRQGIL